VNDINEVMTILLLKGRMKSVWNKLFRTSFIKPDDNENTLAIRHVWRNA